jgi:hypothetical protein
MRSAGYVLGLSILTLMLATAGAASAQSAVDLNASTPSINAIVANSALTIPWREAMLAAARPAPAPAPSPEPMPQQVQGVYPQLYWQASVGYSYLRFYQLPSTAVGTNGVSFSMAYFFKPWIAGEGVVDGGFGSQGGVRAGTAFGGGGVRVRMAGARATELWLHADGGVAHFSPKTNFGSDKAIAGQVGGGVDFKAHNEKMAYRVEADLVGTEFYGTYQVSPKVGFGVVFQF